MVSRQQDDARGPGADLRPGGWDPRAAPGSLPGGSVRRPLSTACTPITRNQLDFNELDETTAGEASGTEGGCCLKHNMGGPSRRIPGEGSSPAPIPTALPRAHCKPFPWDPSVPTSKCGVHGGLLCSRQLGSPKLQKRLAWHRPPRESCVSHLRGPEGQGLQRQHHPQAQGTRPESSRHARQPA